MPTDRPARADEATGPADGAAGAPEAPPPGDPRSRAELYADLRATDRGRITDDAHTTPDGGWSWKGLRLDPAANHVADQQLAARRAAEGRHPDGRYGDRGLTPTLRRVEAQLGHGTLIPDTEKFALKSPNRFKEKLAKMIGTEPDRPAAELASSIHDGIRYTYILEFEHYSSEVDRACLLLRRGGYEPVTFKPNWSGQEYKGINSRWRDPASGQYFEVQFHTLDSWEAKQTTHDAYEKIESPQTSPAERVRLREYQQRISSQIPIPADALDLRPFKEREK